VECSPFSSDRHYRSLSAALCLGMLSIPSLTTSFVVMPPQILGALSHLFSLHCLLMYHVSRCGTECEYVFPHVPFLFIQRLTTYEWILRREDDSNFSLFSLRQQPLPLPPAQMPPPSVSSASERIA
jgi:hypothetical protein